MSAEDGVQVTHNEGLRRFIITVDGQSAGFASYVDNGTFRNFNHTVINPSFRGRGLSTPLIKTALDDARDNNIRIFASCSAVAHFIDKNPEYRELKEPRAE